MKMERVVLSCLLFAFAIILQGCDFGESEPPPQAPTPLARSQGPSVPKPFARKASATCHGGHFACDGAWREWCSNMKRRCSKKDCAPMCAWTCDSPRCNQECGPVCNEPICSTRCKGFNTDNCKMNCGGKPKCRVVCPKHFCPTQDCAACKTECGKPHCIMECGRDEQPCRHVCAQPVCRWECKNPNLCPQPKCHMKCKKSSCVRTTHMFSNVPPLEPGETEIVTANFAPSPAPSQLLQRQSNRMRVNFTRMMENGTLDKGQVDLALVQETGTDASDSTDNSWAAMVGEVNGQVTESEASCTRGKFHCQGDAMWCAEQQKLGCKGGQNMLLRSSRKHSPMQP